MAIKTYEEMNELGLDILKEIGTIGGGNAATALSSMLSSQVQMAVPSVKIRKSWLRLYLLRCQGNWAVSCCSS